jgi:hypothetical protein
MRRSSLDPLHHPSSTGAMVQPTSCTSHITSDTSVKSEKAMLPKSNGDPGRKINEPSPNQKDERTARLPRANLRQPDG